MLKMVGSIFILLGGFMFGYYRSFQMGQRLVQLRILQENFRYLESQITYAHTPLPETIMILSKKTEGIFSIFWSELAKELLSYRGKTFSEVFQDGVLEYLGESSLSNGDLEELKKVGQKLGELDTKQQIQTIQYYLQELKEELQRLEKTLPAKRKLNQSLSIAGSVFLVILLF